MDEPYIKRKKLQKQKIHCKMLKFIFGNIKKKGICFFFAFDLIFVLTLQKDTTRFNFLQKCG